MSFKSTAALLESVMKGLPVALAILPGRWFVDVEDTALLHMAALTVGGVEDEQIFAAAAPYSWTAILKIMHKRYPQRTSILQAVDETVLTLKKLTIRAVLNFYKS